MRPLLRRALPLVALAALLVPVLPAADPRPLEGLDAGQLRFALRKLQVVGSALYVGAHPDDENTAMLAWLSREKRVRTAYLSMTRGDGGQNLIGDELGAELGVIRTQELLAARRVDGAEQMFTRALDFGFSKGPDETLALWGHDSLLADVVWAIRRFRPDVIVTRFPTDGSGGHGHHTASAILAEEAFTAAADPHRFPEQLAWVRPWQAKRLMWNAFSFGRSPKPDSSWLRVELGGYNPLLGRSYGEIAAVSRSNHKSQGFGASERRGPLPNFLALRAGAPARTDLFDGVDLSWNRYAMGGPVGALLAQAEKAFDPLHPEAVLPLLARAHAAMAKLPDDPIVVAKRAELAEAIRAAAGLWLEAVAERPGVVAGGTVRVATLALERTDAPLVLEAVSVGNAAVTRGRPLPGNEPVADTLAVTVPADAPVTQPYWLRAPASKGRFAVAEQTLIGLPEDPPALTARFRVRVAGEAIEFELPVAYRWTDPVQGERWRAFEIPPPATLRLDQPFYAFPDPAPRAVTVTVHAERANLAGTLSLALPPGWRAEPARAPVALAAEGDEGSVRFTLTPGPAADGGTLAARLEVDGRAWSHERVTIDHPHIPVQTLFPPAEAPLVRADIRHAGARVAYVMGSGDPVPEALRQIGWQVTLLSDADLEASDLSHFDAIVTGVRAYNVRPRLRALEPRLLDYVRAGGTLVVQYVTTADGPVTSLGPYPFTVSHDRVTVEEAPVTFVHPGHTLLTTPNAIGPADFDGWVQERGLYFANPWDPRYETVLSCHDPGEPARDGGLLYARYGRGVFVYCAYAMFRQLPAGVPGAWRLFANLVSARP